MRNSLDPAELEAETGCTDLKQLPCDVSPRQYFRGKKDNQNIILMVYPDVTDENCKEMEGFLSIGSWLTDQNIKTPDLIEFKQKKLIGVFEDLGEVSFGKALSSGYNQEELYKSAAGVLKILYHAQPPEGLPPYKMRGIYAKRRQFVDYYMPFERKECRNSNKVDEFFAVWAEIESNIPPCKQGFVHGDFHLENLMIQDKAEGHRKCALIDYQDALIGPLTYDLVNLLEDARVSVPKALQAEILADFCEGMGADEKENFLNWYRIMGTQFHCRVLGLFIMLAAEQGRDEYLIHINRMQNYMLEALEQPILSPFKAWCIKEGLDFRPIKDLNGDAIRAYFTSK